MQVRRGFHRIGMVGLAPLVVLAAGCLGLAAYTWMTGSGVRDDAFVTGVVGILTLVSGGLWYLAWWAIGWIIAGFRSD